ncbi:MAG: GTP-binding protein, partial [Candidatus Levybacteria bacterium]|nr:GTP-binding protein [Candidatus Levybacteria bacterium]
MYRKRRGCKYKIRSTKSEIRKDARRPNNFQNVLNLIDTPGHVDFSYEVDRTLSCVEGVILLVDATQGIQAQTIANAYKAIEKNLAIIPVINKIDLPHAQIEETKAELIEFLGVREEELYLVSAKTGEGVESLLKAVIQKVPPPQNPKYQIRNPKGRLTSKQIKNSNFENSNLSRDSSFVLRALIFDSYYDSHRGVIAFIRLFDGEIEKGAKLRLCAQNKDFEAQEVGVFSPDLTPCERLTGGEIGYVITNLKDIHTVRIGDTIVKDKSTVSPLPGYKKVKPMVFASIFPTDPSDYANLKKALEKLYLNDSSLAFSPIYSKALGAGFRCGFLGLLHAEVVCERLEREYGLDLVLTPPQIEYEPSKSQKEVLEPLAKIIIVLPQQYMGAVMKLCKDHRARFVTMDNKNRIILTYEIPMSEMISDFYDNLKSVSSGYASLDWEFLGYKPVLASKMTVLLNGDPVEEFSEVVVADCA